MKKKSAVVERTPSLPVQTVTNDPSNGVLQDSGIHQNEDSAGCGTVSDACMSSQEALAGPEAAYPVPGQIARVARANRVDRG